MTRQTEIPGTAPVEAYPAIRAALDAWLAAQSAAAEARQTLATKHDELLDAITAEGIPYYTYDLDGKRRRVYPTATPRLKTEVVGKTEASNGGRKVSRDDVESNGLLAKAKRAQQAAEATP